MYIDKLDDIVNKCNNRYYRTIKIKPVDVKLNTYIDSNKKKLIMKILNLKLLILLEYQNINMFQIGLEYVVSKVKNTVPWTYIISDLKGEEIV